MPKDRQSSLVGKAVDPPEITGTETALELVERTFTFGVGRQFRQLVTSLRRAIEENHILVWSFSGILTPSAMHRSCVIPLIKAGLIDILSVTNAIAYHDIGAWHRTRCTPRGHALEGRPDLFEVNPTGDDLAHRDQHIVRIYDVGIDEEEGLLKPDILIQKMFTNMVGGTLTTADVLNGLGNQMAGNEKWHGYRYSTSPSLLVQASANGVPMFNGEFWDGSIALNLARMRALGEKGASGLSLLNVDGGMDVHQFASFMHYTIETLGRRMTVVIIGGGVPKNYALQIGPYLTQVCGLDDRLRYATELQICDAPVDNASLSSAPASEAFTWDKVEREGLAANQYVRGDWSVLLPLLTGTLFAAGCRREPSHLYSQRHEALKGLNRALAALPKKD